MPFMLYMSYSTLFVQENASKDKIVPSSLDFAISEIFAISEMLAKFQWGFAISEVISEVQKQKAKLRY